MNSISLIFCFEMSSIQYLHFDQYTRELRGEQSRCNEPNFWRRLELYWFNRIQSEKRVWYDDLPRENHCFILTNPYWIERGWSGIKQVLAVWNPKWIWGYIFKDLSYIHKYNNTRSWLSLKWVPKCKTWMTIDFDGSWIWSN